MDTAKLSLDHKDLLYDRLRAIDVPVSEYSFANIYLFRDVHEYEVLHDEQIFIKGRSYDGFSFLMPTIDVRNLELEYLRGLMSEVDFIFPVPEAWRVDLGSDQFQYSYKHGDTDYLYTTDKMASYSGRKLHKKRNLLRQFERLYEHEACPLTKERLHDARVILEQWQDGVSVPPAETDYHPCQEALKLYDELMLCDVIYYVEDEPAGFIVGDELNEETFALHFAIRARSGNASVENCQVVLRSGHAAEEIQTDFSSG